MWLAGFCGVFFHVKSSFLHHKWSPPPGWAELCPNSRRAKVLVCYRVKVRQDQTQPLCHVNQTRRLQVGVLSVPPLDIFFFITLESRGLEKNPYLRLHQLKVKSHPPICHLTPSDLGRKMKPFFFCSRGCFTSSQLGCFI